jgi:hypothetical protein
MVSRVASAYRRPGIEFVRRYHRLWVEAEATTFDDPVPFVANHGFGGIFDLRLFAIAGQLAPNHRSHFAKAHVNAYRPSARVMASS